MKKGLLLGLLMLLPWGTTARAADIDYDPMLCDAFEYNTNPAFEVPVRGQYRLTIDCRHCGGFIQNYQITLMSAKRGAPSATMIVLDASGASVGVSDPGHHSVYIGNVPTSAVYTVVVMSGSKRPESCVLYCSGAI
jgi:hypothetical protein